MTVLLWADAGPALGLGHLSRALAIAEALAERGAAVRFAVVPDPTALAWLEAGGHRDFVQLPGTGPVLHCVATAAADADALVVDVRRPLDVADVEQLRAHGRVVLVDNAGTGTAAADLVVAPFARTAAPHWLVGPAVVPLRGPRRAPRPLGRAPGGAVTVLVSLGATDPGMLALPVVEALATVRDVAIRPLVVANPETPVWPRLEALLDRLGVPPAEPVRPGGLGAHLDAADLAVLAFGVTVYEAMAAGVPAVVLCRSEDDAAHAAALAARGALRSLGTARDGAALAEAVAALACDAAARAAMARAGQTLVDGRGAARVAERIAALLGAPGRPDAAAGAAGLPT